MSFQQLYYTSCEQGLSGYPGYQFNAVTDGTSSETMRRVESLTAYDPPSSGAYADTPEELDRCPLNLCFAPGEEVSILASVRYTGRDSSRRFGNYFAHAVATSDLEADLPDLLPVQLWRAPWWNSRPAAHRSLPELSAPLRPGPLSREQVERFLDGNQHRERLAALLSAVGLAQAGGARQVLVVAESADEVALWFAAVSYLLPPRLARKVSFSTYLSRPSRSKLHLLGTIPETKLDLGPDAPERFFLFDFPGERFTEVAEHPLARLCSSIGARELPELWRWADTLADGREATLNDWHPVVAAAAALGMGALAESDLTAVCGWLLTQPAGSTQSSAIARAVHRQPLLTADHRRALREVSGRTGDSGMWSLVHYELLEPLLQNRSEPAVVAGAFSARSVPSGLGEASARVQDQLTVAAEEQLRQPAHLADALGLLDWAGQAGLRLDPDVLASSGTMILGPLLTASDSRDSARDGRSGIAPAGPAGGLSVVQREQANRVTQQWPQTREGIVRYLTELFQREPHDAWDALSGASGEVLARHDLPNGSPLLLPYLTHQALRRHEAPVRILGELARRRIVTDTSGPLLITLWPTGTWSLEEAIQVTREVDPAVLAGALGWFEQVTADRAPKTAYQDYTRLADALVRSPLLDRLAADGGPALREIASLHRALTAARTVRDLVPAIKATRDGRSTPARVFSTTWIAPKVAALPPEKPQYLLAALTLMHPSIVPVCLRQVAADFTAPTMDTTMRAAALWLFREAEEGAPFTAQLDHALGTAARGWRRDRLEAAARHLDAVRKKDGREFRDWYAVVRGGRFAWLVKLLLLVRSLRRRAKLRDSDPASGRGPAGGNTRGAKG